MKLLIPKCQVRGRWETSRKEIVCSAWKHAVNIWFDGDLICTINNPLFEKGRIYDFPVVYESQRSEKKIVDSRNDAEQVDIQLKGHNSKVGFATNISSSIYSLLEEFDMGSKEYEILQNRLRIGRAIQGEIIDGVKGLEVPPFREHWTNKMEIPEDASEEDKERIKLYNRVVCKIRPAYFRFLYPHYMRKYNKELRAFDIGARQQFRCSFESIYKSTAMTDKQAAMLSAYRRTSEFLNNHSVVNRISDHMRQKTALASKHTKALAGTFDYSILLSGEEKPNSYYIAKMKEYLQEYKAFKRSLREGGGRSVKTIDEFLSYLREECYANISSSEQELTDCAVLVTYGDEISMLEFPWAMFPNGVLNNLLRDNDGTIKLPVKDDCGDIEYLWSRYRFEEFPISYLYGEDDEDVVDEDEEEEIDYGD